MERVNVTLDDLTLAALAYLKEEYGTTASAAIRHAVIELARRNGWKRVRRRTQAPAEGGVNVVESPYA